MPGARLAAAADATGLREEWKEVLGEARGVWGLG